MAKSNRALMVMLGVLFLWGTVGLVQPPPSQADVQFGGIKKILKKIFPPCGPGTRDQRFVVKGEKVCDNKTGLWWQRTPGDPSDGTCGNTLPCEWQEAKDYCSSLELNGKHKKKQWRLAELKEYISLVDYSVEDQAASLNTGLFTDVQSFRNYWSATEVAGILGEAWHVWFGLGYVFPQDKDTDDLAWCVSGGEDAH